MLTLPVSGQSVAEKVLLGHVPRVVLRLQASGRLPGSNNLSLAIGLPLRNREELHLLLSELYNPASPNFRQFLMTEEFTRRFGPTEQDYLAVREFARQNGFVVTGTHDNRLVLDVDATVADVERAFHVTLRTYRHPTEAREFFAPDKEPTVPADLPVVTIEGLNDFAPPRPLLRKMDPFNIRALGGSGPGGYYAGNDFRHAYAPGTTLTGAGQAVGLLEFSSYYQSDITKYEDTIGRTNYVPLNNVVIGHPAPGTANNAEVALDIEVAIAMAPGLSQVIVYEIRSNPSSILSRMANDNLAKQLSCSWTWSGGPSTTIDNILLQMAAQGQSFFQASGDSDAYTGSQTLDNSSQTTAPVDSTNLTCVGGTTLTMNGSGVSWSSETVWNWNNLGRSNIGSGGGISTYYKIPYWQTNMSMAANSGSTTWRNVPDVALTADAVYVAYNNGSSGGFGGTSCAAPLWAGFCALVNQQSMTVSGKTVGFLNPTLYGIGRSGGYTNFFHDITTGNNIGTNTPGLFYAVAGYDLATGLGTPNGTNLINALAPSVPVFLTQPISQNVANGANVALSTSVVGASPLVYAWQYNGANLIAGGNISGVTSNVLSITSATTNNSGSYRLVVTNSYGAVTGSVAVLNVGFPPAISTQPTNLTVLSGSNALFSAVVSGNSPLTFQWRKDGTNLVDGGGVAGATSNVLELAAVALTSSGNYSLTITNLYGAITSSTAVLTIVAPPGIAGSITNRAIECGSNLVSFFVTASGTPPLAYQWSFDSVAVAGATNTSYSLTNLHLPDHTVAITVTNLYGSVTSNASLTVLDTRPPAITLTGGNPIYIELGDPFTDPGAMADDVCAGAVGVLLSGTVNTGVTGTNTLTYTAADGNGNTNSITRSVIVRDTTPPTILWNFANLVLAADTNCSAAIPDVTGTNYILATDLSGALTVTQTPTNGSILALETNIVVIAVEDESGNAAFVTNTISVTDQTPPIILSQPESQTNPVGTSASFSLAASACSPLAIQWFFNSAVLTDQTNSTLSLTNIDSSLAGAYTAVVTASGGATTSVVATLTVEMLSSSITLVSSANPVGYKDNLNFIATVTPSGAVGTVQFSTNGVMFDTESLVAGEAVSADVFLLPRGTNLVSAAYSGDASYLPSALTIAQIITNHPPSGAPAYYTNTASFTLNIPIADLVTNWSDVDEDTVFLAGFDTSTNGITLTNNGTDLVYFNPNNLDDQFNCIIADGWGGTNIQVVTIAASTLSNTAPLITGIAGMMDGSVTLKLSGATGYTYILETTPDLFSPSSWQAVATNTLDAAGVWQFSDLQATNFSQRFYRLKLAP